MRRILALAAVVVGLAVVAQVWMRTRTARVAGAAGPPTVQAVTGMLSAGPAYVLAVSGAGDAYGWGTNIDIDWDKAGPSGLLSYPVPTQLTAGERWGYVYAGTHASYAITTYGRLWRRPYFQNNRDIVLLYSRRRSSEQAGLSDDAAPLPQYEFKPFLHRMRWVAVKQSQAAAAGLDTQGHLWIWHESSLSSDDRRGRVHIEPRVLVSIATGHKWIDFCLTANLFYAVDDQGDLWNRGLQALPRDPASSDGAGPGPVFELAPVKAKAGFKRVVCRENAQHVLLLDAEHRLWGFGDNRSGELGNGSGGPFAKNPSAVGEGTMRPLNDGRWIDIAVGPGFTYAIAGNGSLWSWGNNSDARLGIGKPEYRAVPTLVDGARVWIAVTASHGSGAALSRDGEIYTWGANNGGVLGEGGAAGLRDRPTRIMGAERWGGSAVGS